MQKVYKNRNGTIYVTLPESCDRDRLKLITEDFARKIIIGGNRIGNSNKTKHLRKK